MKMRLLGVGLAVVAVLAQGCLVIRSEPKPCPRPPSPPAPVSGDATIVEIDAVSKLALENNRLAAYDSIAGREGLSEEAQVHLVAAVFGCLALENSRVNVLMTLINGPSFSPTAKRAILDRLDGLALENDRAAILAAMGKR